MKRSILILALLASLALGQTYLGGDGGTYAGSGGGGRGGVRLSAAIEENGGDLRIIAKADMGVPINVAVSAYVDNLFDWHGNGQAWDVVAEDTTSAVADGRHTFSLIPSGWTGWEGDTVIVQARIYTSEGLAHVAQDTFTLDAPGDLQTVLWLSGATAYVPELVSGGFLPADTDTGTVFTRTRVDDMAYVYLDQANPAAVERPSSVAIASTRSLYNAQTAAGQKMLGVWFNMEDVPTSADVVFSRVYAIDHGDGFSIPTGYYAHARLDTAVADLAWLDAPAHASDPLLRQATWNSMDFSDSLATHWTPNHYQRDDLFEYGIPCGLHGDEDFGADDGSVAGNEPWWVDTATADQAYLDMGDARVNAGYWFFRTSYTDGLESSSGIEMELGNGTDMDANPVKVMQYVTGTSRAPAWGVGRHRIPLVAMFDDAYDEQHDFIETWGAEDVSFIIARSNLNPFYGGDDANRIWNTDVDTFYRDGLDIVLSMKTAWPLADLINTYGEQRGVYEISRDWITDLLPETLPTDTTAIEWKDFAWNGGTDEASFQALRLLQDAGYRSARGYSGMASDPDIGSGTRPKWDGYVNAFNIYPDGWNQAPDALTEAAALEELLELVDAATIDGHRALMFWGHSDDEVIISGSDHADAVTKLESYRAAADSAPVVLMTYEEVMSLRLVGQVPVDPSPDDTPASWLPAPSGVDTVWARVEDHVDRCWYPPFVGSAGALSALGIDYEVAAAPDAAPMIPTGLAATPGDGQVALDWDDASELDVNAWSLMWGETSGALDTGVSVDASEYTVTGLTNGTTYYFAVRAVDDADQVSEYSAEVSATPAVADVTAPTISAFALDTPDSTGADGNWRLNLSFTSNEAGTAVVRFATSIPGLAGADTVVLGASLSTYDGPRDTGILLDDLNDGTIYGSLTVTDASDNTSTAASASQAVTRAVEVDTTPPTLTAADSTYTEATELASINVTSDELFTPEWRYRIYDTSAGDWAGAWSAYASGDTTTTNFLAYLDATALDELDYVRFGVTGDDAASNTADEVYADSVVDRVPSAPTIGTATPGDGQLVVTWTDPVIVDVDSASVYVGTGTGGPYTLFASGLDVTAETVTVTGLTNSTTYYCVVTVTDASDQESDDSGEVSGTPSAGGGGATVATGYLLYNGCVGSTRSFQMGIYDSSGNLLASSNTLTGIDNTPATLEFTFASGPTLTSSETYYVALSHNGALNWYVYTDGGANATTGLAGASLPDPLSGGSGITGARWGVWLENSSGTMILGDSDDPGDYTTSQVTTGGSYVFWATAGYVAP